MLFEIDSGWHELYPTGMLGVKHKSFKYITHIYQPATLEALFGLAGCSSLDGAGELSSAVWTITETKL